eukprot:2781824-Prymnesium_polylepis.1
MGQDQRMVVASCHAPDAHTSQPWDRCRRRDHHAAQRSILLLLLALPVPQDAFVELVALAAARVQPLIGVDEQVVIVPAGHRRRIAKPFEPLRPAQRLNHRLASLQLGRVGHSRLRVRRSQPQRLFHRRGAAVGAGDVSDVLDLLEEVQHAREQLGRQAAQHHFL